MQGFKKPTVIVLTLYGEDVLVRLLSDDSLIAVGFLPDVTIPMNTWRISLRVISKAPMGGWYHHLFRDIRCVWKPHSAMETVPFSAELVYLKLVKDVP